MCNAYTVLNKLTIEINFFFMLYKFQVDTFLTTKYFQV